MTTQGKIKLIREWPQSIEQLKIIAAQHAENAFPTENPYDRGTPEWHLYIHFYAKRIREIATKEGEKNQWMVTRQLPS